MPNRRHLSVEAAAQAIGLLDAGLSFREVGRRLNVRHSVISRLRERHQQTGSVKQRPRCGRPKKTSPHQDREMVLIAKRERITSAKRINSEFRNVTGILISDQTVRNRLHTSNLQTSCTPTSGITEQTGWKLPDYM